MTWTARDVMSPSVTTVRPDMTLAALERAFLREEVSGFPVVEGEKLVGMVSRSDVVRQLAVEQSRGEMIAEYAPETEHTSPHDVDTVAHYVGQRTAELCVRDLMISVLIETAPDAPLEDVARRMLADHIHRLPVLDRGRLVGIVTTGDFLGLIAEGRLQPK